MSKNRRTIAQQSKGQACTRATKAQVAFVQELRQGSTAQPHRDKTRYHRASEKRRGWE